MQEQTLIEKIRRLPPERIAEIEDFVDFLAQRAGDNRMSQNARDEAIAAYAAEYAGTGADLDPVLEAAAFEHWQTGKGDTQ